MSWPSGGVGYGVVVKVKRHNKTADSKSSVMMLVVKANIEVTHTTDVYFTLTSHLSLHCFKHKLSDIIDYVVFLLM